LALSLALYLALGTAASFRKRKLPALFRRTA
jgi:hypothetical protein